MNYVSAPHLSLRVIRFSEATTPDRDECRALVEETLRQAIKTAKTSLLSIDAYGKPSIEGRDDIAISYSHSQNQLVIAMRQGKTRIGIDTEPLSRVTEIESLAEAAFSRRERKLLDTSNYVPAWCLKEAAVKRLGKGFRDFNPSQVTVLTNGSSYGLALDEDTIERGYYMKIVINDDVILYCDEAPVLNYEWHFSQMSDYAERELGQTA